MVLHNNDLFSTRYQIGTFNFASSPNNVTQLLPFLLTQNLSLLILQPSYPNFIEINVIIR